MIKKVSITFLIITSLCFFFVFIKLDFEMYAWNYLKSDRLALYFNDSTDLKKEIAWYYFNNGAYNLEKSKKYYQELYSGGDRDYLTIYQLGRINFIEGSFNEAHRLFDEQLSLYPREKRGCYMKGLTYVYEEKFLNAQDAFRCFVKAYPEEWAGYNDLAWAYIKTGDFNKALEVVEEGLGKFDNNLWLNNLAGVSYWNMGDLEKAQFYLEKAYQISTKMSPEEWGSAYPGNNPDIYSTSLEMMREQLAADLKKLESMH